MALLNLAIILFLIMDPLGNISSFLHMLDGIPTKKRRVIIIREMLIALAAMVLFNFIGELIFDILKVSDTTLKLASGVILFLVGIKILFPSPDSVRANLPTGEPFITPLAIPLIAGPSLLATIMLFAHLESSQWVTFGAILIAWTVAVTVLLAGTFLKRILTVNGLMACERLMGMVLILLAIQRFLEGVKEFIKTC